MGEWIERFFFARLRVVNTLQNSYIAWLAWLSFRDVQFHIVFTKHLLNILTVKMNRIQRTIVCKYRTV